MNDIETMSANSDVQRLDFNTPALQRKRRIRALKDKLARWYVSIGGLAVLGAITLIFFYLAQVVAPMFQGAELEAREAQQPAWLADASEPLLLAVEEQNKVAMRLGSDGAVRFFSVPTGELLRTVELPLPAGSQIVSVGQDTPGNRRMVLGLSNGQVLVAEHNYKVSYPEGIKTITPQLDYPFGEEPLNLDPQGRPIEHAGISLNGSTLMVAGATNGALHALKIASTENLMTGETTLEEERMDLPQLSEPIKALRIDPRHMWLFAVSGRASVDVFDVRRKQLNGRYKLLSGKGEITTVASLLGGISLMVGDSTGGIGQWFMVRSSDGQAELKNVRNFQLADQPITQILPEERRKGFLALDSAGTLGIFHSTAHRELLTEQVAEGAAVAAMSPRATRLLVESGDQLQRFVIDNPHPEISWSALWGKVWYESYPEPDYVWQSTSATGDFEPKLSLSPLAFGTLKAAFYAMLLAAPLAICAALYTAYFMAPTLRRKVKPVIELMEALPTVILGFFAGLFLAPYLENHLPGIFSLLLLMPVGILLAGWFWSRLPENIRLSVPDGWEALLLIPVILAVGWGSLAVSGHLENWFFGGDMRLWLSNDMGIPFDQRNALVIGIAMGFAVIPTIYSIAEDAVFSVPRSLTLGSLALGATPWQTLTRVVLLTASPGIFSALMIGMGRAVGETMIVLMATGNTPIMEANIFEGMRTLAANVAVEMPESEVGSTHYRVLFLAAMVLLMFTFVMNTLAELIRQRLRRKYASL
ncbi:MAG: ABC transporter permease subunit [Gammaproteobacteria bacterium]|jgi:phosphate transport system permease protein|uniref:ABC transporter permease subunit n=1 Tax=Stutzerimonas xanthomarina TaxID=271420 RepID=UPI00190C159C|nr:ABC transporter permease subunit [Stutzerimonas xanthomarina]MBU1458807.1 ABC transporter permease subunit [Gammaproteobacteria bacterium]MBK3849333.1 ABC transporter permease subunit [Stutzerimonas xanthomarina]MBU1773293.1 ABC transporter permease subunit [Gammaproteobacteria bacterium]MBU2284000.1 ABC transporter permease subunit [Gammaproteobacteria bacterium]MBU2372058.1 ABC transporter permease subunit [Gammaproteobacteria bacterium]|tara:strand:- start:2408 stop:4684 length:2277 start_codon:yes stop_codon:yes gene_type:complete